MKVQLNILFSMRMGYRAALLLEQRNAIAIEYSQMHVNYINY